jgi:hypothetical protein
MTDLAWRRSLLIARMDELAGIRLGTLSSTGAIRYSNPPCVRELLANAVLSLKAGKLDQCERLCVAAEQRLIGKRHEFQAALLARSSAPPASEVA